MQALQYPLYRKIFLGVTIVAFGTLLFIFNDTSNIVNYAVVFSTPETDYNDVHFLVSSSKCKMSNLNPFNEDAKRFWQMHPYKACTKHKLLSYVRVTDNLAQLHIDKDAAPSYTNNKISCCYSNVTRKPSKTDPDQKINVSPCSNFEDNVTLHMDPVLVVCKDAKSKRTVYENAHTFITVDENVQRKMDNFDNTTTTTKPINVMFIGIDSISRLNFIRSMPSTYNFVEEHEFLPLLGYNKMGDNTFPNVMAILTGMNQTRQYSVCDPKTVGKLDDCAMLLYDFRKLGYITAYAEDETNIGTFNYRKKGFTNPPSDYYFRPYAIAALNNLKSITVDDMNYCTGPETYGERILNIAKDFTAKFKDYPSFGFFWMNSYSHNKINSPSRLDRKVKEFFEELKKSGVLERDLVIFISDHGMRFGNIRLTYTGWLEERLPFIYISFPPWFKEKFPVEYNNFKKNKHKLTSPYDLHMTLQHLLVLSGFNRSIVPSEGCPGCKSLLLEIEQERSCEDVGVDQHWCTCAGYQLIDLESRVQKALANFVVKQINQIVNSNYSQSKCAKYYVSKIISTSASEKLPYSKHNYILIKFETFPKAIFETTVLYTGELRDQKYEITGDISRLDLYAPHSYCIKDSYLKKYCYCR